MSAEQEISKPRKKGRGGRPRKDAEQRAGVTITLHATEAEAQAIRRRARASGLSVSRYLVECALSDGRAPDPAAREQRERALFHLRKVGANLNQLAHGYNAAKHGGAARPPAQSDVERAAGAVAAVVAELGGAFGG